MHDHRLAGEQSGLLATPAFFLDGRVVDVSVGFERPSEAVLHAALIGAQGGAV